MNNRFLSKNSGTPSCPPFFSMGFSLVNHPIGGTPTAMGHLRGARLLRQEQQMALTDPFNSWRTMRCWVDKVELLLGTRSSLEPLGSHARETMENPWEKWCHNGWVCSGKSEKPSIFPVDIGLSGFNFLSKQSIQCENCCVA